MASLSDILSEKLSRLETVPDNFSKAVLASEREIFNRIIGLISQLETKEGVVLTNAANIKRVDTILNELKQVVNGSEYTKAVALFAKEFTNQGALTDKLFEKIFDTTDFSKISKSILDTQKRRAVDLLVGSSLDKDYYSPIRSTIDNAVSLGSNLSDLVSNIRKIAEGENGGRLYTYSKQIANDSFAIADRAYTTALSKETGAEWFRYVGGTVKDSRPFCTDRDGGYFHKEDIERWGNGDVTAGILKPTERSKNWQGKIPTTDSSTIFYFCGGYNCKHALIPVLESSVPDKWKKR